MTATVANPDRLIAARPQNGSLTHAVFDQPEEHAEMGLGHLVMRSVSLCGMRARDAWGGGGWRVQPNHEDPDGFDHRDPRVCVRCARKYRRLVDDWWAANSDDVEVA